MTAPPAEGRDPVEDLLPLTLQVCPRCGGEGRLIYEMHYWSRLRSEPGEIDRGECPECEGSGGVLIPTELPTEEEIMEQP